MLDIHSYETRLVSARKAVENSELSECNKEIIVKFTEHLALIGVGKPRQIKYLEKLKNFGLWLKVDFDKATKEDIEKVFLVMHQRPDWKMSTKIDYNILVKRFYRWLLGNDEEFPEQVKWLKTNLKFKDKPVPNQDDLITEAEMKRLIEVAANPRDRAFVSVLYETGCRIGEIANLAISNVMFDQYGCVLNVNGKTGPRRIRVVNSTSYLTQWLEQHPLKNNRNAPLWILLRGEKEQLKYNTIRIILQEMFERAGINKRCNPHIFRHSRATFMANHMTEAQMKAYFGWVQHSDMASIYVHLSGRDTDNAILEINGLQTKKESKVEIQPKKCPKCGQVNSNTSNYCSRCSGVLDMETAVKLQDELIQKDVQHEKIGDLMGTLMQDKEFKEMLFKKVIEMKLGKVLESI